MIELSGAIWLLILGVFAIVFKRSCSSFLNRHTASGIEISPASLVLLACGMFVLSITNIVFIVWPSSAPITLSTGVIAFGAVFVVFFVRILSRSRDK